MSIYFQDPFTDEDYFKLNKIYYPFRTDGLIDVIERVRERDRQRNLRLKNIEKAENIKKPEKINNIKENKTMDMTVPTTSTASTTSSTKTDEVKRTLNFNTPSSKESSIPDLTQVNTSNVILDVHTLDYVDNLKNYAEFDAERNDIESTLDSHELNDKINYILQFYFESFSKSLKQAIYNKSTKEITITLEIPVYEDEKSNTYATVMNQVAHKKAVKIIRDTLQSKGFYKIDIKHETTKSCIGFMADITTKVQEYYVIIVQL